MILHKTEPSSGNAAQELEHVLAKEKRIAPFYANLARIIIETNNPFLNANNERALRICADGLAVCPTESYWSHLGTRDELEILRNRARSLKQQQIPDRTTLHADPSSELDTYLDTR